MSADLYAALQRLAALRGLPSVDEILARQPQPWWVR